MTANWPTCCMPGSWQHACRAPGSPPMPCTKVWAAQCQALCLLHACVEHPFAWSIPLHGAPLHGVPFARRVPPCCASFTQFTFCTASLCTMHPIARCMEHPSVHCTLSTVHLLHPFACHIPLCDASLCTWHPFARHVPLHSASVCTRRHCTAHCFACCVPLLAGPLPTGASPLSLQVLSTRGCSVTHRCGCSCCGLRCPGSASAVQLKAPARCCSVPRRTASNPSVAATSLTAARCSPGLRAGMTLQHESCGTAARGCWGCSPPCAHLWNKYVLQLRCTAPCSSPRCPHAVRVIPCVPSRARLHMQNSSSSFAKSAVAATCCRSCCKAHPALHRHPAAASTLSCTHMHILCAHSLPCQCMHMHIALHTHTNAAA